MRLTRIDDVDLNLFRFDYDLTFMVFFMTAQEQVYARYGGRDAKDADNRQSLGGLLYTMKSVLLAHEQGQTGRRTGRPEDFAPRLDAQPRFARQTIAARDFGRGACIHCHQVQEERDAELRKAGQWSRASAWRYPLPENLGIELEIDRGNTIKAVRAGSPARTAGLKASDVLDKVNGVPIHSFADAQFALDIAPATGDIDVAWRRGDQRPGRRLSGKLSLPEDWKKTSFAWRASMRHQLASTRLYGSDLKPQDKLALGLSAKQLAFRQGYPLSSAAQAAGVREGDVILGFDGQLLEMDLDAFRDHVRQNYMINDRVTVNLLRDGKRLDLSMTLAR